MRKAGLKQRSRRKGSTIPADNGPNNEGPAPGPSDPPSFVAEPSERRKPTSEEAALSARNNRLAKELVRFYANLSSVTRIFVLVLKLWANRDFATCIQRSK